MLGVVSCCCKILLSSEARDTFLSSIIRELKTLVIAHKVFILNDAALVTTVIFGLSENPSRI